jgi:hypothetical protein
MELNGLGTPISSLQSKPIVQPQAVSEIPEAEPEVAVGGKGRGKAKGVVRKLNEGGHFNEVANVRLRISHFDNPDLKPVNPDDLPDMENIPSKAYEKFLGQYQDKYENWLAGQSPAEPDVPAPDSDATLESPSQPDVPAVEIPTIDSVILAPLVIEPILASEQSEPEVLIDEGNGVLAAIENLLDIQTLKEESGTLDIVI